MQIIPEWGETSATVHHGGYGWQECGPGPLQILAAQEEESREGRCTSAGARLPCTSAMHICHAHHLPVPICQYTSAMHICRAHLPCTSAGAHLLMHICHTHLAPPLFLFYSAQNTSFCLSYSRGVFSLCVPSLHPHRQAQRSISQVIQTLNEDYPK